MRITFIHLQEHHVLSYAENEVVFINIGDISDYDTYINIIPKLGHVKYLILNFTSNTYNIPDTYNSYYADCLNLRDVENLFIEGNGATIKVEDNDEKILNSIFLNVNAGCYCCIKDMNFVNFKAIKNAGTLSIINSSFSNNMISHVLNEGFGAAIYNDEDGYALVSGCSFSGNAAKRGAAVYNMKGIFIANYCNFTSNKASHYGGAIYNELGTVYCFNSNFSSNSAEDEGGAFYNEKGMIGLQSCNIFKNYAEDGGAVFSTYGVMNISMSFFKDNSADDDGGTIYNDFSEIAVDNCLIQGSQSRNGEGLFRFGKDSKYIINYSYIQDKNDTSVLKDINIVAKKPSEFARWAIRAGEVIACVALTIGCTLAGIPEVTAGVICFIGGGLLAAGEEFIEEVYFDHNVNAANIIIMFAVAGMFDGVTGAGADWIGIKYFGTAIAKPVGKEAVKLGAISFGLELAGEILTEVLPRVDFSSDCPFKIDDIDMAIPNNQTKIGT